MILGSFELTLLLYHVRMKRSGFPTVCFALSNSLSAHSTTAVGLSVTKQNNQKVSYLEIGLTDSACVVISIMDLNFSHLCTSSSQNLTKLCT